MQRYDISGRPIIEQRASGPTAMLAGALIGLAEVLEPRPPKDLGAEVVDAEIEQPEFDWSFGPLEPLD